MIDREALDRIHARLVAGDVVASSELFRLVHRALTATLRKRVGTLMTWEEAADTATDAIVEYTSRPGRFDPSRSGLFGYLLLIARRDALDLLRKRGTAQKNLARLVELWGAEANTQEEAPDVRLDADRILHEHRDRIVREDGDELVLRLYLEGVKETVAYAEALGLAGLSPTEQKKAVKTRKDRIEQRLKRLREVLK